MSISMSVNMSMSMNGTLQKNGTMNKNHPYNGMKNSGNTTTTTTTNNNNNHHHQGATRVWVQASAVEAIRNPKVNRFKASQSRSFGSSSNNNNNNNSNNNMSDDQSESGSSVFSSMLSPSSSNGRSGQWDWMPGLLVHQSSQALVVRLDGDTDVVHLESTALGDGSVVLDNDYDKDPQSGAILPPNDLITLTHLHEPAVVQCLALRYQKDLIYTATGPVLLALNPFKSIRGLYGDATMKKYWDRAEKLKSSSELPPHVYQIADASFRTMMRQLEQNLGNGTPTTPTNANPDSHSCANQAILVSGESGAGKTVTTKFVMKYLAALSQRSTVTHAPAKRAYLQVEDQRRESSAPAPQQNATTAPLSLDSIESKVLQSNPILESFGNARTIRNDNSSRFGKFIEIQFTQSGKLVGATIETYLLEKVRLVTQSPGERNYHVFFELLSGAMDPRELRQYYLAHTATPQDFRMMDGIVLDRRDGVKDADTFRTLRTAMDTMNFSSKEQKNIFSVTAALLHASNLDLVEGKDVDSSLLDYHNVHLEPVCQLLGVAPQDLSDALCTFSIQAGRDGHVKRSLPRHKAQKALEALIKATYGAMFQYLVMRINDSIAYQEGDEENISTTNPANRPAATIGVLDIFGFESFTVNSFEQLCINYCNEALQQQFNAFVLKNEQEEYEREGIEWSFIEFPENQDVLDLIDKRGSGILNILDDQCRAPGTTDRSFASDVYAKCTDHGRFRANRKQVALHQFEVHHYAGFVEYSTVGFVEKNRDEMHNNKTELLAQSTNPFVSFLSEVLTGEAFAPVMMEDNSNNSNGNSSSMPPYKLHRSESSSIKSTVGGQFRHQLKELRRKIDRTCPHYVRCLKPNDCLVADEFAPGIVAEQLRCGGILEAVRVSRAGFPQHYPHAEFVKRYKCVAAKEFKATTLGSKASQNGVDRKQRPSWSVPAPQKKWQPPRGAFRNSYPQGSQGSGSKPSDEKECSINYKDECKTLMKIIARKIQVFEMEENKENGSPTDASAPAEQKQPPPVAAKAKTYASSNSSTPSWMKQQQQEQQSSSSFSSPSNGQLATTLSSSSSVGSVKSRYQPWTNNNKQQQPSPTTTTTPSQSSKPFRRGGGAIDFVKVGIQMGKTKVFLRHSSFEVLERIRSRDLTRAATTLNSVFRMYLSRMAYVPVRDAYRAECTSRGIRMPMVSGTAAMQQQQQQQRNNNHNNMSSLSSMIDKYESEVRASIHNIGRVGHDDEDGRPPKKLFKWVLQEGIWVKNRDLMNDDSE